MITLLFWNIRGVGNNSSIRRLKNTIKKFKIYMIAIQESKIDEVNILPHSTKIGFSDGISNVGGKIWILWNINCRVDIENAACDADSYKCAIFQLKLI